MHLSSRISAAALVLLTGCLEYHTTTTVRDDGRILRTVVIRGDSSGTHGWNFVVPVDTTWTWERVKSGDREWTLTAEREFSSDEAFNTYTSGVARQILRSTVSVERTFKWFTTTFRFREHLPSVNPFRSVPLADYVSPSEFDAFLQHEVQKRPFDSAGDSLALEDASDRFEAWARRNEFEALFGAVRSGVTRLADRTFPAESLDVRKERLAEAYEALKDTGEVFDAEDLTKRKDLWLKLVKEPVVRRAAAAAGDSIKAIEARMLDMHRLTEYPHKSSVVLPGLLTSTNARSVDGSTARWENYLIVLYFRDYTLEAESSETNWWAVIVTGVLAVGIPGGWFAARRRRG